MNRMSAFRVVCAVGVLLLCGGVSRAGTIVLGPAVPLDQLLFGSGNILVGDKLFDQFSYAATGNMPTASNVNVIPIVDSLGNFGIRFQGAFGDLYGNGGSDALITYQVMATHPQALISDVHLAGNPLVLGHTGKHGGKHKGKHGAKKSGLVGVTETFLPGDPTLLSIFDIAPGPTKLTDFAFLTTPVKTLDIQKDIIAFAGKKSGATLSFIDQTFSQVLVPEPSTVSLLLLGLAAAWGLRRKALPRGR